jgi:hypothetical protein
VQRYIDSTVLRTLPYSGCIDLTNCGVSSVVRVFRTEGYMSSGESMSASNTYDPMYMSMWQSMGGSAAAQNAMSKWTENIAAYNTAM